MKNIYVVLYKNFTALDVFGPVEVLSSIDEYAIHYVSLDGGIIENKQSIRLVTEPLTGVEGESILLIPGGFGSRNEINNSRFIEGLSKAMGLAEHVLCVCTGSVLAAKTGALDGKRATSNKRAFEWAQDCCPKVNWVRDARWVVDGKFYTSAGVSAGIDMALGFVRDIFGADRVLEICTRMEYHWNSDPDHDTF